MLVLLNGETGEEIHCKRRNLSKSCKGQEDVDSQESPCPKEAQDIENDFTLLRKGKQLKDRLKRSRSVYFFLLKQLCTLAGSVVERLNCLLRKRVPLICDFHALASTRCANHISQSVKSSYFSDNIQLLFSPCSMLRSVCKDVLLAHTMYVQLFTILNVSVQLDMQVELIKCQRLTPEM